MKLSAPKLATWWIAITLGAIAILNHYSLLALGPGNSFVFLLLGYLLLLAGTVYKGL